MVFRCPARVALPHHVVLFAATAHGTDRAVGVQRLGIAPRRRSTRKEGSAQAEPETRRRGARDTRAPAPETARARRSDDLAVKAEARKRVVSGGRVSVRVDIGGVRILRKTHNKD